MEAACCVSVQHLTAAALPKAFGTGSSQGVPLQFDVPSSVWGLEMLSLIIISSLQNDQMLSCNSLEATDRVLCRKVNWRECGGSTLVSVYVIAALSNDFGHVLCSGWPLEYGTWVWMASVLSHPISAYFYGQTKCGAFQSRIWFRSCLDGYLPSYLLVSSTQ